MPIRTSLITGKKLEKENFFRFTIQDGLLVFDTLKKTHEGRGGYVEKEKIILEKLFNPKIKKKIQYFLHHKGPLEIKPENFPSLVQL